MATIAAIKSLRAETIQVAKSFNSYNFREYFVRKTESTFQTIETEKDESKQTAMYSDAVASLVTLRRSAIVNQLYGGRKLAVEEPVKLERGNN